MLDERAEHLRRQNRADLYSNWADTGKIGLALVVANIVPWLPNSTPIPSMQQHLPPSSIVVQVQREVEAIKSVGEKMNQQQEHVYGVY